MFISKKAKQVLKPRPSIKNFPSIIEKKEEKNTEDNEVIKEPHQKKKKEVNNKVKINEDMSYNVNNVSKAEELVNNLTNNTDAKIVRVKQDKGLIEKCDSNNKVILIEDNRQVIFD